MAPRRLPALYPLLFAVALVLGAAAPAGHAAPALQETATPTLAPTDTPRYVTDHELSDGSYVAEVRQFTWGEAAIVLAIVAYSALFTLRWLRAIARGKE